VAGTGGPFFPFTAFPFAELDEDAVLAGTVVVFVADPKFDTDFAGAFAVDFFAVEDDDTTFVGVFGFAWLVVFVAVVAAIPTRVKSKDRKAVS
jgi:hypothetical protein